MEKIWLKSYPAGVPAEIDMNQCASLNRMLAQSCQKFGDRPAFRNLDKTITYADTSRLSRDFAAWLQSLPDLKQGTRVAIMLPNLLQYPIAMFGILRAGMVVVNVNPLYTARELEHQLKDSGAEVIVILENFAHVLQKVIANTRLRYVVTTQVGDVLGMARRTVVNFAVKRVKKMVPRWRIDCAIGFRTVLRHGAGAKLDEFAAGHDDVAFLQYTGGTTGVSKGAVLTHGNLIANLLQAKAYIGDRLQEGTEVVITALPLYHIFSLTTNCLLFMELGGLNVLITNPKDMAGFIAELKKVPFTLITGVNTLYNGLLNRPEFAQVGFRTLKVALGGGAAIQPAVAERWKAATGCTLVEGYGLTEASPFVSCNPLGSPRIGSIGLPMPSTEVRFCDEQGFEVPLGGEGEMWVRGPQVMQGYWQRPTETAKTLTEDGWLRTGDVARMDAHGYITITDRKKDMILVSGFNVYPNEVEGVLAAHPGVLECAVVGVPDANMGEAVKAFVVRKEAGVTADQLIAYCRQSLTNYKVPRSIEFRTDLPKSPVGKIIRRELRVPSSQPAPQPVEQGSAQAGA